MSGLCGFIDFEGAPGSIETLRRMSEVSAYRGPDGVCHRVLGEVALAHLASDEANQPLMSRQPLSSPDGQVWLLADARLDNRDELRKLLVPESRTRAHGACPSDADLILAAYLRWSRRCPERLLGDYALVIWDARHRWLFCACDPLGIKPLYYARIGPKLCFASQVQQILQYPAVSPRLDEVTIGNFLCGVPEDPGRTFFRDVRRLPPAHHLLADDRRTRVERYWDVDPEKRTFYRHDEDYVAHFRELFSRAVEDRLRLHRGNVGIAMSGGLDSCSVAAIAQRHLGKTDGSPELIATSFVFDQLSDCDERSYIAAMAAELGIEVHYVDAEKFWILQCSPDAPCDPDTPEQSYEALLREMLKRLSARNVRVFLTGNGGDEVIGGSLMFFADRLRRGDVGVLPEIVQYARWRGRPLRQVFYRYAAAPLLPRGVDRTLRQLTGRDAEIRVPRWISGQFRRRIGLDARLRQEPSRARFAESARQEIYDHTVGLNGHLFAVSWYDRIAARFGMEARHPFLDRRLIEYVLSIPHRQLFKVGSSKHLLRRAMRGLLPQKVRQRPGKTNLTNFVGLGLRFKEAERIEGLLQNPLAAEMGIVERDLIRSAYHRYRTGAKGIEASVFYPIALELWLQEKYPSFSAPERARSLSETRPMASVLN